MSSRLKARETGGIGGLHDLPLGGAPPELTEADIGITGEFIKEHPDFPEIIPAESVEKTCGKFSMSSLKRIIKKLRMRRKRVRRTVGKKETRKKIEELKERQKAGISDSYFSDRPDSHREALFRMHISRSEKHPGFRRPAEGVSMLPVFTVRTTSRNHPVPKTQHMRVLFPPALMNFQRCL